MADFLDVEPLSPMVVDCANGDAGTLYECIECRALAVFPSFSYPTCPQCLGGPMRALAMGVSASEAAARYGLSAVCVDELEHDFAGGAFDSIEEGGCPKAFGVDFVQ